MTAIDAVGLHKTYRRWGRPPRQALRGVDLHVDTGGVHGFLGPNGSGKTTTLRALLGLVRLDAGQVRLLGRDASADLPAILSQVGTLVEGPQFFGNFSGRRNLELLARVAGLPRGRVRAVLEQVRLDERGDDPVTAYSLGMRQRLGIAAALLKSPRLLLLDEPTNGMDPAGIREVRDLIRDLGRQDVTVLLSSHLLGEVQQVCDAVTIVSGGSVVRSGSVRDVLAGTATAQVRARLADPSEVSGGVAALTLAGWQVRVAGDFLVVDAADPAAVNRRLGEAGIWASELTVDSQSLEDVFLALTDQEPP